MLYNNVKNRVRVTPLFVYWDNIFSDDQLQMIREMFEATREKLIFIPGIQSTATFAKNSENSLIFDRISQEIDIINELHYQFDLYGFDDFQYKEFTSDDKTNWDVAFRYNEEGLKTEPVKLVVEFLLNDDFTGGNLEFNLVGEDNPFKCDCVKGRLIVFPSWHLARVGPVKDGIRRSLIFTVKGPRFK